MQRHGRRVSISLLFAAGCVAQTAAPPRALTWQETVEKFRAINPTLLAGKANIEEARAEEITAYLRPNPTVNLGLDQVTPFSSGPYRPLSNSYAFGNVDYLHERRHKRELRLQSAQETTLIATSAQGDLERNLLFSLRDAFNRLLLAKAVAAIARQNLDYYDRLININRDRFNAGAIAKVDFQRVELQRIQFVSDFQTAQVNLLTAKIDLQQLLRDRTPVDQFDINQTFEFSEPVTTLEELHNIALATRPDLKEAEQTTDKARTDHRLAVANGSTDPVFGLGGSHQPPPLNTYLGVSVSVPLRIFDRNQGEKLRTQLDIGRTERLQDAAQIATLHDVDAAYATLQNTLTLLRPYKTQYLKEAEDIRGTVSFAFEKGAASLLDFLDAQRQYRDTQLSYLNLVGAYFSASNQINFAVGREVIQ
jgi:cobalt-zinc-cadmium efflux system outer membrane protein